MIGYIVSELFTKNYLSMLGLFILVELASIVKSRLVKTIVMILP